jgi:hypothetical protein
MMRAGDLRGRFGVSLMPSLGFFYPDVLARMTAVYKSAVKELKLLSANVSPSAFFLSATVKVTSIVFWTDRCAFISVHIPQRIVRPSWVEEVG